MARAKNITKLLTDYLTSIVSELDAITTKDGRAIPEDKARCCKVDQSNCFFQCMLEKKHKGTCLFTPKGAVCPGTVRSLISCLTAGDVKSLAGLDDTKVLKGKDNFRKLREICDKLYSVDKAKLMRDRIDECKLYHKTDYVLHLTRVGSHRCNCLSCGFCEIGM